tara:strand:- start:142 stop:297 length:156 start_codon:yes stop_codon:yes gene_type:complete
MIITSTIEVTIPAINRKRANHQYSDLVALPEKTAYLEKHIFIDEKKLIIKL